MRNELRPGQALRHLKIYGATLPAVSGKSQELRRDQIDLFSDRRLQGIACLAMKISHNTCEALKID